MNIIIIVTLFLILGFASSSLAENIFEKDTISSSPVNISVTFIAHGTLMMEFDKTVVHIDPVGQYADYSKLPRADLILITHHHGDHLDKAAIGLIRKPDTDIILSELCTREIKGGIVMKNGDSRRIIRKLR
ncbi:MBL fold metallo-hydrolase [Candidatus Sumerlaeota bacterium]|nr:MBL fold metallo-hydrolase [Candidatus Sumerlaeota bacterium]